MPIWLLKSLTLLDERALELGINVLLLKMYFLQGIGLVRNGKKVFKIHSES